MLATQTKELSPEGKYLLARLISLRTTSTILGNTLNKLESQVVKKKLDTIRKPAVNLKEEVQEYDPYSIEFLKASIDEMDSILSRQVERLVKVVDVIV